jgi:chemotaxis protein CheY-P-specific phosphatase CheC
MTVLPTKPAEIVQLAAASASRAFSALVDRPVEPFHAGVTSGLELSELSSMAWERGVVFELQGAVEGGVALLFSSSQRDALVARMLGADESDAGDGSGESALMEVANIVVSHVVSEIAEVSGQRLLPSVPTLIARRATGPLDQIVEGRESGIELHRCALSDAQGELGGALLLLTAGPLA